jgi:dihydrofolate reductase
MTVSAIVAVARNGVIGRDGQLPWRLPDDLRRFRKLTTGHHVIMGRATYESIGRPLPDRENLVLTRSDRYVAPGCTVLHDLDEALEHARSAGDEEAFVIGGAALYALALPRTDRIYLTRIEEDVAGDTTFPPLGGDWVEVSRERHEADPRHAHAFTFTVLERAPAPPDRSSP